MDRREFLVAAAAPLVLGAVPAAFAGTRGGTPLALVTADLESAIVAVDLSTGVIQRRLATPSGPRSIESIGAVGALVAHTASGRMSLVDSFLRVRPVRGEFGAPRYTAASPELRFAYVSDSEREEIVVVDVRSRQVVGRTAVGGPARHLSLDSSGGRLWVALGTKAAAIAVVDVTLPRRPRLVGTFKPPFLAHDVGFTPGGRRVWVTSGDRDRIAIYEAATARLVRTFPGDAPPQHVTFHRDRAFITSGDDGLLRVHSLDGRRLNTVSVPAGSYNVQEGWDRILTPSLAQGTLCVFGTAGVQLEKLKVARSSHDACFIVGA